MSDPSQLKATGLALFRAEKYAEAATTFAEAAALYAAQQDTAAVAEMRNNQGVAYIAQQDYAAALEAVNGTPEMFQTMGETLREAQARSTLADILAHLKQLAEAANQYEQAIALLTELNERTLRAACWQALAKVQTQQHKVPQALVSTQASLRLQVPQSLLGEVLQRALDTGIGALPNV